MQSSRGSRSSLARLSIFAFGLALGLAPARALHAGSTKPNYPALKMQAEKTRGDLRGVDSQWTWLSGKFTVKEWGAQFEALAQKHDVAGLNQHLKSSGFTFTPLQSTDKVCQAKVCLALPNGMDDWATRKSQHAAHLSKLDAFLLKLSQDKAFGEKFEQLVMHNNRQGLLNFFQGAGFSPGEIQILTVDNDFRCHFKCWLFEVDFGW